MGSDAWHMPTVTSAKMFNAIKISIVLLLGVGLGQANEPTTPLCIKILNGLYGNNGNIVDNHNTNIKREITDEDQSSTDEQVRNKRFISFAAFNKIKDEEEQNDRRKRM